jgi:hypothetical protein
VRDKPDYVVGLGTGDREAVPALVKDLKSKDPSVRSQAAEDLGQVGPDASDAVPALRSAAAWGSSASRSMPYSRKALA